MKISVLLAIISHKVTAWLFLPTLVNTMALRYKKEINGIFGTNLIV